MKAPELLRLLTSGATVSLAVWHGDPVSPGAARAWWEAIRNSLHSQGTRVPREFNNRLAEMMVRYWRGQDIRMVYENLRATAGNDTDKARLELCYGQLLLARKHDSAWRHLDAGFALAAHLFEPDEYFEVLNRHDTLKQLLLSPVGTEAAGLDALLKEAGVIRRLRGPRRGNGGARHQDTID